MIHFSSNTCIPIFVADLCCHNTTVIRFETNVSCFLLWFDFASSVSKYTSSHLPLLIVIADWFPSLFISTSSWFIAASSSDTHIVSSAYTSASAYVPVTRCSIMLSVMPLSDANFCFPIKFYIADFHVEHGVVAKHFSWSRTLFQLGPFSLRPRTKPHVRTRRKLLPSLVILT